MTHHIFVLAIIDLHTVQLAEYTTIMLTASCSNATIAADAAANNTDTTITAVVLQ